MTLEERIEKAAEEIHEYGSTLGAPDLGRAKRDRARLGWPVAVATGVALVVVIGLTVVLTPFSGENTTPITNPPTTAATTTTAPATTSSTTPSTTSAAVVPVLPSPIGVPSEVTWSRLATQTAFLPTGEYAFMTSVTVGGPGLIAVGAECLGQCINAGPVDNPATLDAAVWVSSNGESWERLDLPEEVVGGPGDQIMTDVVAGPPGVIALGTDTPNVDADPDEEILELSVVWFSPDGLEWQRLTNPTDGDLGSVTTFGSGFIAIGGSDDGQKAVRTSANGTDWTRLDVNLGGFGAEASINDFVAGHGMIIAVGDDNEVPEGEESRAAVWRSTDGVSWERIDPDNPHFGGDPVVRNDPLPPSGGPSRIDQVYAVPQGFIGVGRTQAGVFDRQLWVSPDGLSWTRVVDDDDQWSAGLDRPTQAFVHDGERFTSLVWEGFRHAATWHNRYNVELDHPATLKMDGVAFAGKLIAVGFDPSEPAVWIGDWK